MHTEETRVYIAYVTLCVGDIKALSCGIQQNIPHLQGYIPQLPSLYSLSAFNEFTKCVINPLRDIHICLPQKD